LPATLLSHSYFLNQLIPLWSEIYIRKADSQPLLNTFHTFKEIWSFLHCFICVPHCC